MTRLRRRLWSRSGLCVHICPARLQCSRLCYRIPLLQPAQRENCVRQLMAGVCAGDRACVDSGLQFSASFQLRNPRGLPTRGGRDSHSPWRVVPTSYSATLKIWGLNAAMTSCTLHLSKCWIIGNWFILKEMPFICSWWIAFGECIEFDTSSTLRASVYKHSGCQEAREGLLLSDSKWTQKGSGIIRCSLSGWVDILGSRGDDPSGDRSSLWVLRSAFACSCCEISWQLTSCEDGEVQLLAPWQLLKLGQPRGRSVPGAHLKSYCLEIPACP